MSFGFSVGDFAGAGQLAWDLYRYSYIVSRDAPKDFKPLLREIAMLSQSIRLLGEEAANPNSTMVRAGEDRVRMVRKIMVRVEVTLKELKKHSEKYDKFGDVEVSRRNIWAKFKWPSDAAELDSLRNKLVYHNGVICELLNSFGNYSLQRIESANLGLEGRFSEIEALIGNFDTESAQDASAISAVGGSASGMVFISSIFMKNAEVGQRIWSSIGVDEWIQAGKWWLMKAQMEFSQQAYIDLIKSSWILIDVIAHHPQLNLLEPGISFNVELLANTIRNELGDFEALGTLKPGRTELLTCDLDIWVSQARGPTLKTVLGAESSDRSWVSPDEDLVFQRFGVYHSHTNAPQAPCLVLLVMHRTDKMARIVLGNQNSTVQEEFLVGKVSATVTGRFVQIQDQKIELSTALDALHLSTLWGVIGEYLFRYKRDKRDLVLLKCLALLVSLKNNHETLTQRLLEDQPDIDPQPHSSDTDLPARLWVASSELVPRLLRRRRILGIDLSIDNAGIRLFSWATRERHETVTRLLLEVCDITISENEFQSWYSLAVAARNGHLAAVVFHLSDRGVNDTFLLQAKHFLREAIEGGCVAVVDKLLQAGADPDEHNLLKAIELGQEAMVNKLLQAGVDANKGDPMVEAVNRGHGGIVDKLLKAGADPNDALRRAVQLGHEAIVDRLLQSSAVTGKRSLLLEAVELGSEGIVDMIHRAGGRGGSYHLYDAVTKEHEGIVNKLLQFGVDANVDYILDKAVESGNEAIVDALLRAGAHAGGGALRTALKLKHWAIIDRLLKAGANPNDADLLATAVMDRKEAFIDRLLRAGADVNKSHALMHAASQGNEALIDKLLNAGANVNSQYTLLRAVAVGHEAIVDKLLQAGADVNQDDILLEAVGNGNEAIVDKLLQAGANLSEHVLLKAVEIGHGAIVDKLLLAIVDVNNTRDICFSPLVAAVSRKDGAMVVKLLNAGACLVQNTSSINLTRLTETSNNWDLSFVDRVLQEFSEAKPE